MRKALFILSDLEDSDIIWLASVGEIQRLEPGETLIRAGREVTQLYFVIDGELEVIGGTGAKVADLGMGDVVGEMSFVERRRPDADVRTVRGAELLAISRETMLTKFQSDHGLAMRFYRALAVFLSDRLRTASGGGDAELDEGLLDNLQQAGERFIRLINISRERP